MQQIAVVLLSGGLDSTTALAIAKSQGFTCCALTVAYGQLHACELEAATRVATHFGALSHKTISVDLRDLAVSALTGGRQTVPKHRTAEEIALEGVPPTYVPARNTILLAMALAWAESLGARDIFLGINVLDASGYPDCRPEFLQAFSQLAQVATKPSATPYRFHAPLIAMTKAEIIRQGIALGVDYSMTHSCYAPDSNGLACGHCDACSLRKKGFLEAAVPDPTLYVTTH